MQSLKQARREAEYAQQHIRAAQRAAMQRFREVRDARQD